MLLWPLLLLLLLTANQSLKAITTTGILSHRTITYHTWRGWAPWLQMVQLMSRQKDSKAQTNKEPVCQDVCFSKDVFCAFFAHCRCFYSHS